MDDVSRVEFLDRIDRVASQITQEHLFHLEEARRYSNLLGMLVELRADVQQAKEVDRMALAVIEESSRPVPPAAGERVPVFESDTIKARSQRRKGPLNVRQVG